MWLTPWIQKLHQRLHLRGINCSDALLETTATLEKQPIATDPGPEPPPASSANMTPACDIGHLISKHKLNKFTIFRTTTH